MSHPPRRRPRPPDPARARRRAALGVSLPSLALGGVPMLLGAFLPRLYAEEYGVSLSVLARGALLASVADALAAPAVGALSDRARRAGVPRAAFVLAGSLPMAAFTSLVFAPPADRLGSGGLAIWCLLGVAGLHVAKTAVEIPLHALATELTSDYDLRNSIVAVREALGVCGALLAAALPTAWGAGDQRQALARTGACFGAVAAAAGAACALSAPARSLGPEGLDGRQASPPHKRKGSPLRTARELLCGSEGASARALLLSQCLSAAGASMNAAAFAFFIRHVLFLPGQPKFDPTGPLLGVYVLASVSCLPFWVWLGGVVEKRAALTASLLVQGAGFLGIFLLCGRGRGQTGTLWAYGLCGIMAGCAGGGPLLFPASMRADLCTQDEHRTAKRREGEIEGIFALASRFCQTLGAVSVLVCLRAGGFQEGLDAEAEQPPRARAVLHFVYCGLPGALLLLAAVPLQLGYSLDRARQKECAEGVRQASLM